MLRLRRLLVTLVLLAAVGFGERSNAGRGVGDALAVVQDGGVEEHELGDAIRCAVRHSCDHGPAIAVPHQDHVAQILMEKQAGDILDVGMKAGVRGQQMRALA